MFSLKMFLFCLRGVDMSGNIAEELYDSGIGKVRYLLIILGIILFSILGSFLYLTSAHVLLPPTENTLVVPAEEQQFIKIIGQYAETYVRSPSDSAYVLGDTENFPLRMKRKQEIKALISEYSAEKWVGTVKYKQQNSYGDYIFAVSVGPIAELASERMLTRVGETRTLITKDSPIYQQVSILQAGDIVIFSGSFYPCELDYFKESSDSNFNTMTNPNFVFKFKKLEKSTQNS